MKRTFATVLAAVALIAAASIAQMIKPGSAPGGGGADTNGLVLLETETASASATLDFACPSATYNQYDIVLENLILETNDVSLYLLFSVDGGSNFLGGTSYQWNYMAMLGATFAGNAGNGVAFLQLANNVNNTPANYGFSGTYRLSNVNGATFKQLYGKSTAHAAAVGAYQFWGGGWLLNTSAITDFRIVPSSGGITSGVVYCQGIAQ